MDTSPVQRMGYSSWAIWKKRSANNTKASLRVCGDYSDTVNPQLEVHRHPLPLPEDLMKMLGGGYGFTKIDLADAYNQIKLAPESRKRLALSTHRGVLLQNVLLFGISSAPGFFQQIMDDITRDLPGVAFYLDDILVSGNVINMPEPTDLSTLQSFLGSVQFYSKFLPPGFSTTAAPLYRLLRDKVAWKWTELEKSAFEELKHLLSSDSVMVHFDSSLPLGIACDASSIGIGATLFHRHPNGDERTYCQCV